jgi:hypothetical protein
MDGYGSERGWPRSSSAIASRQLLLSICFTDSFSRHPAHTRREAHGSTIFKE